MGKKVLQADGSYCYTGASCKKHGTQSQIQTLNNKINSLLTNKNKWREPVKDLYIHIPKKYYLETLTNTQNVLKTTGLTKSLNLPEWNKNAIDENLSELQVNENTSLLITSPNVSITGRARITTWLVDKGKTVAALTFLIPLNKEAETYWGVATIASVEVPKTEQGKGYASKTIKIVEKHLINQKLHSNGQYTPEGAKAFKNKIPYSNPSTQEKIPLLEPMKFVENWEKFWMK